MEASQDLLSAPGQRLRTPPSTLAPATPTGRRPPGGAIKPRFTFPTGPPRRGGGRSYPNQHLRHPTRNELSARFDRIFGRRTGYTDLDDLLWRLSKNRDGLLRVLDWPATPLHTNGAERDIRARATRRKISFGTRSGDGRVTRDVCPGAMKTCARASVPFQDWLRNRLGRRRTRSAEAGGTGPAARRDLTLPGGRIRERGPGPDANPGKLPLLRCKRQTHSFAV